jgi:hypothetical protein
MLSAAIAYRMLLEGNHNAVKNVKATLASRPWFTTPPVAKPAGEYAYRPIGIRSVHANNAVQGFHRNHFGVTRQTTKAVRKTAPRNDARPKGKRT